MTVQSTSRRAGVELGAIHPSVEEAVNRQDLDGLMALYADDASLILLDGTTVRGADAIREQWAGIVALGGTMTLRSRYTVDVGDLAVLSNEWVLQVGDERMSSVTAEVARRQPDGGWLYLIDHPFAGAEAEEIAALQAATAAVED